MKIFSTDCLHKYNGVVQNEGEDLFNKIGRIEINNLKLAVIQITLSMVSAFKAP